MQAAAIETNPGLHVAVSTGSLLDFSRGPLIAFGALTRRPDLYELENTYKIAEDLGIGAEVAYRVLGTDTIYQVSSESSVPLVSVHMPIFANRYRFIRHGFPLKSMIANYAASEFGLGFAESSMKGIRRLAAANPDAVFVAHPDLALWLDKTLHPYDLFRKQVGVEADFPSIRRSSRLITDTTRVVEIIHKGGFVANPDTSHNSLTYNPPVDKIAESLVQMVDAYGTRLRRIHFSANSPYPEGQTPSGWGAGSLPLNSDLLGPEHVRQYHEWYLYTDKRMKELGLTVHMPIEIYGWTQRGRNGELAPIPYVARQRGIEATMEGLVRGKLPGDSRSYPGTPTRSLKS